MLETALQQPVPMPPDTRFRRPRDIVKSRSLLAHEKRAILAAWASDYHAVESKPALRQIPGLPEPVTIDEVQRALKELDLRHGA
ncbi:hypothetical protein [Pararhizobium arenae]|uniref:hypothetical protein n=1 Tax=Pararhizobium arenae TaxID=1856850 RepID=UPI00094B337F|nr:hypothetical protein [Pararhizobium arenae]